MKLSICGKGGSGKSILVSLLARELSNRGYPVLVVDSDESNSNLYRMLGLERAPLPLMDLVGGKKALKDRMGNGSVLRQEKIRVEDIPAEHVVGENGVNLVSVGKIHQALEGCACPMGVLNREFLKKLELCGREITLVDMEAGIEHFGRGVETSIDRVLLVVEPSLESLDLAGRINELSRQAGISRLQAVINKADSEETESMVREELSRKGIPVAGSLPYDPEIFRAGLKGVPLEKGVAFERIAGVTDSILEG